MYDVFISYSTKEAKTAEHICELLEEEGVPCWMAPRDIALGSHWAGSLTQAIRNAKIMVLVFSRHSNDSEQVVREVTLAAANKLILIPFKIDDTVPNDDFEYLLSVSHWLDAAGRPLNTAVSDLAATVREILKAKAVKQTANRDMGSQTDPAGGNTLDIYDENMDCAGTAARSKAHSQGLWHKTFHCWFISKEAERAYVWVQKRSALKADFPGLLDITAARHLNAGESDREGINNIDRELGVSLDFEDVIYLGIRTYAEKRGAFFNQEFNSVYLYDSPYTLGDFDPQPDEVNGILKIAVEDGLRLFSGSAAEVPAVGSFLEDGGKKTRPIKITAEDFVPRVDNYYQKIFAAAREYFEGERKLSI